MSSTRRDPNSGAIPDIYDSILYGALCLALWISAEHTLVAAASDVAGTAWDHAIVALCAIGMFLAYISSDRSRPLGDRLAFVIGALCGLQFFACTLSMRRVDPTNIAWLLQGDWAQHYAGWALFRDSAWTLPPGALPNLLYPVGSSIAYTDSLPLLAFALKPFSMLLPDPFQYIGAWIMMSFVLQGGFGALLVSRCCRAPVPILAGSALFVYAPILISRIGHDTLTAHWLLLAGIWLCFRPHAQSQTLRREMLPWWLLAATAALVHPYLAAMVTSLHFAYWGQRVCVDRARGIQDASIAIGVQLALTVGLWWLSGDLLVPLRDAGGGQAYGHYSFNLLGFFNPMGYSRLLPALPVATDGQYEGFSYLGLGILALLVVLAISLFARKPDVRLRRHWPLFISAAILVLLAASFKVTFGSATLFGKPLNTPLLAAFRSSGRFIWVAYYLIVAATLWGILRRFGLRMASSLLVLALAMQIWDLMPTFALTAGLRGTLATMPPGATLLDPHWDDLVHGKAHITFAPPPACAHEAAPYLPFQLLAAKHGMTLNTGYVARWNARASTTACMALHDRIAQDQFDPDAVYIVGNDWRDFFTRNSTKLACATLDSYMACVARAEQQVE